jgi:Nif-specific regulatory protein
MITLEVIAGQSKGSTFELDAPVLGIGRAPTNHVVLADYHLSGEHGQIFREDDRYIYRDLRSTNGSRILRGDLELILDGPAGSGRWEAPLSDGDRLVLGNPAEPVILHCRVRIEDVQAERQELIA